MKKMDELLIKVTSDSTDYDLVRMNAKKLYFSKDPYVLCDFAEYVKLADTKEIMNIITQAMIRIGDIVHLYELYFLMSERKAKNFNYKEVENIIKRSGNSKLMNYCLSFTDVKDEEDMLACFYATKNAKWIERLKEERDVSGLMGYKEALEIAYDYNYFPKCLEKYPTRDISNLMELAIKENNPYILNELADYMEYLTIYKGASNLKIEELIPAFFHASVGDPLHQYEIAESIDSIEKAPFAISVVEEGIAKIMYYMYEYVKGVDKSFLARSIKDIGNEKYIKLIK